MGLHCIQFVSWKTHGNVWLQIVFGNQIYRRKNFRLVITMLITVIYCFQNGLNKMVPTISGWWRSENFWDSYGDCINRRCKAKKIVMMQTLCASKKQFLRNPWKCWCIFNIVTVLVFSCTVFNKTDCTETANWNLSHRTHPKPHP